MMANFTSSSAAGASSSSWSNHFEFDDADEIKQNGKVLIKLSERKPVFVVPDIFRDQVYINIREYTFKKLSETEEEEEGEGENPYLIPSKKGVCFTEEEFKVFIDKIDRVKSLVKRLKKKQSKAAGRQSDPDSDRRKSQH